MILLHKIDQQRNENKYYSLHIQPDLFGQWALMRYWGRIGKNGQLKIDTFSTLEEAQQLFNDLKKNKIKKGYFLVMD
ncbi:WGR domain-containing protein [Zooshikella sp. RANM57]|uniref:WGR domain-containing protein n=1 Tax=Zooshikella sp. RANM57 TaxID=3425863 RepID=UPI003D6F8146